MNIDVKHNSDGHWFYSFAIEKGVAPQTLLAVVTDESATTPINSISNSPDNVKRSVKKSDIVANLVSTYNYTQETANKVFANAYNLKKKTGSKADVQEISAIIANALEKRRNGDFGESDITAVADLIASGSKTENETVISEAKPILDYLKGINVIYVCMGKISGGRFLRHRASCRKIH